MQANKLNPTFFKTDSVYIGSQKVYCRFWLHTVCRKIRERDRHNIVKNPLRGVYRKFHAQFKFSDPSWQQYTSSRTSQVAGGCLNPKIEKYYEIHPEIHISLRPILINSAIPFFKITLNHKN